MTDRQRRETEEISKWPASQEAERLLRLTDADTVPGMTPMLAMLMWAVEDGADQYKIDPGQAPMILEDLLYRAMFSPMQAVTDLLGVDDPEEELPGGMTEIVTRPQAAKFMLDLANGATDKSPFA
jgi:hypothetical protein